MIQKRPVQEAVSKVLDGLDFMNSLASVLELDPPLKVITKGPVLSLHTDAKCRGRPGRSYVPVKLRTNASSKSFQQLMLFGGKLFNQDRAEPCSMSGAYRTATLLLPPAMPTAVI